MLESVTFDHRARYEGRPYEWIAGTAQFAVDPTDAANGGVVDLTLAPCAADGKIRFESDIRLLQPTARRNGRVLLVVPNRGMVGAVPFSLDVNLDSVLAPGPMTEPDSGDGFLLDEGWTIAWCGWQWDVRRDQGWLGLDAPMADVQPGWMRLEFRPDTWLPDHRLSDSSTAFGFKDYPCLNREDREASLTARTSPLGNKELIPRDSWRFTPAGAVEIDGGFQPYHWYELVYRSSVAPVVGTGLLAVRDFVAWLRESNDWTFGFGISQSGRFLRQFLYEALNVDERGTKVFDGLFTHIAGARRGEFNCRYGQPSLTHPLTPAYGPPYDTAALLAPQRRVGGVPRLFATNSAWEYWRGDGALVHQDPESGEDLPEDPDARVFLIAGTDHIGSRSIKESMPVANPVHLLDDSPILRSLFVQLERWVCSDVAPPPSCVPRRRDGTAVNRASVLSAFSDVSLPDIGHLPWTPDIDPQSTSWPLQLGRPTVALVSAVDDGGNEIAGIRLPAVAVPVAAYTGWNPRAKVEGLPDVLYEFVGSRLPLQDGRLLPGRFDYRRSVLEWAHRLVHDRFLLERDVPRTVTQSIQFYEREELNVGTSLINLPLT